MKKTLSTLAIAAFFSSFGLISCQSYNKLVTASGSQTNSKANGSFQIQSPQFYRGEERDSWHSIVNMANPPVWDVTDGLMFNDSDVARGLRLNVRSNCLLDQQGAQTNINLPMPKKIAWLQMLPTDFWGKQWPEKVMNCNIEMTVMDSIGSKHIFTLPPVLLATQSARSDLALFQFENEVPLAAQPRDMVIKEEDFSHSSLHWSEPQDAKLSLYCDEFIAKSNGLRSQKINLSEFDFVHIEVTRPERIDPIREQPRHTCRVAADIGNGSTRYSPLFTLLFKRPIGELINFVVQDVQPAFPAMSSYGYVWFDHKDFYLWQLKIKNNFDFPQTVRLSKNSSPAEFRIYTAHPLQRDNPESELMIYKSRQTTHPELVYSSTATLKEDSQYMYIQLVGGGETTVAYVASFGRLHCSNTIAYSVHRPEAFSFDIVDRLNVTEVISTFRIAPNQEWFYPKDALTQHKLHNRAISNQQMEPCEVR